MPGPFTAATGISATGNSSNRFLQFSLVGIGQFDHGYYTPRKILGFYAPLRLLVVIIDASLSWESGDR
jgi:hypothetical protein